MKRSFTLRIDAGHPAFDGHFPGTPVLPGVVLLERVLDGIRTSSAHGSPRWQVQAAKFLRVVSPGEELLIEHEAGPDGSIRWWVRAGDEPVANGVLRPP